jgi:hypothetical protein
MKINITFAHQFFTDHMELKDIVSIAGVSGLHKIIGRSKNGLILETIGTSKRFPTGIQDKVSVLEDISMYTMDGDVKLNKVLVTLNSELKNGTAVPTGKDEPKKQREFLSNAIKIDNERVYDSDIKKLLTWFHLLKDVLNFETLLNEETQNDAEATNESKEAVTTEVEKPKAKKPAANKVAKNTVKDTSIKASKGASGAKNTYRPKSV